uniref:Heterochromatin-stabilizing protein CFDP1 n=1 Tax=Tragulus javanicus TaxID=9849 RepID=CFDP1_TRAJA|nr:RecName: Full=Craniofacial development protein 1; AltName: Full=Bucentaur; AltName: Full=h-type BCNT protein [Tragulus javanicus]BAD60811.1 human-type Bcnt [Tragulus javanicus]
MEEFDSEDFSTSEEDEDYVPSGGEYSEDDINELVKEDEVDVEEETHIIKGTKRKAERFMPRKRKQGGLSLEEEDEEDAGRESGGSGSEEEDTATEQEEGTESEDARKKKEDELWASFLNDVGPKSKVPPSTPVKTGEETEETSSSNLVKAEEQEKPKETEKVKITKVFDFAGEEVRVTKEVDPTSKEAKSFFKQSEKEKPQPNVPSAVSSLPAGSGLKRSSGMSSLLGKIGAKKQKMSTLEKSKLDWENFKEEEGIAEELAIHNRGKEGYIERKAFLDRVDHRQFEIERDLRLSKMKP